MPVRRFDGVDDQIRLAATGSLATLGAITVAHLIRPRLGAGGMLLQLHSTAGNGSGYGTEIGSSSGEIGLWNGETTAYGPTGYTARDEWRIVVINKASGAVAPRVHTYSFATRTWTRTAAARTLANGYTISGGFARLGAWESEYYYGGDMAATAVWATSLADGTIDTLATVSALVDWARVGSPIALWLLDQASVGDTLLDLVGSNHQSAGGITGTTVLEEAPPIPYRASALSATIDLLTAGGLMAHTMHVMTGGGLVELSSFGRA